MFNKVPTGCAAKALLFVILIGSVLLSWNWATRSHCSFKTKTPSDAPLIFIGGHESSGTGLMRILLDAHPKIRCGGEPMVTRHLLDARHAVSGKLKDRLTSIGVYPKAYDEAVAWFILKLLEEMGPPDWYICHKQPLSFIYLKYLAKLFPKAKFINMLRDGRAAVASTIIRDINKLYTKDNPYKALQLWEGHTRDVIKSCQQLGRRRCYTCRYEYLVQNPEIETKAIFEFLEIQWDPIVLRHETILNQLTSLTPFEASTAQFTKKIHNDSLSKWANPGYIFNETFLKWAEDHSALLKQLGYTNLGHPPSYRNISQTVPTIT